MPGGDCSRTISVWIEPVLDIADYNSTQVVGVMNSSAQVLMLLIRLRRNISVADMQNAMGADKTVINFGCHP